jgi:hypothetical protein
MRILDVPIVFPDAGPLPPFTQLVGGDLPEGVPLLNRVDLDAVGGEGESVEANTAGRAE